MQTRDIIQALSGALIEQEMPGSVIEIMLDYAAMPLSLDKKDSLPVGNMPFTQTIEEGVRQRTLHHLHFAILSGNLDSVIQQLEENPEILLEKLDEKACGRIQGPSGHKASLTAYRTALATEDTQMAEKIKAKLIEISSEEEARAQFNAQFPTGWEEMEKKKWAPIFTQLESITQAIKDGAADLKSSGDPDYQLTVREESNVARELIQFRSLLDATLTESAITGRHFHSGLLLQAFQIYDEHFDDYFGGNWSNPRALLFWQQVIGYIQRFMPANYVQAFCDGLYNSEEELKHDKPQGRSLKVEIYDGREKKWQALDVYPLAAFRLGFDFGLGRGDGLGVACGPSAAWRGAARGGRGLAGFRSLCQSKSSRRTKLMSWDQGYRLESTKSFCVTM